MLVVGLSLGAVGYVWVLVMLLSVRWLTIFGLWNVDVGGTTVGVILDCM